MSTEQAVQAVAEILSHWTPYYKGRSNVAERIDVAEKIVTAVLDASPPDIPILSPAHYAKTLEEHEKKLAELTKDVAGLHAWYRRTEERLAIIEGRLLKLEKLEHPGDAPRPSKLSPEQKNTMIEELCAFLRTKNVRDGCATATEIVRRWIP